MIDELRKFKPYYFGLGFIQVKVGPFQRYHFYNDELPAIVPLEEIHTHRYTFRSEILKGSLDHRMYCAERGNTHKMYAVSCRPDEEDELLRLCQPRLIYQATYVKGTHYTIHKDIFHQVDSRFCITRVDRQQPSKDRAEVIRLGPPTCPFSKVVPESQLWEIIEAMIEHEG